MLGFPAVICTGCIQQPTAPVASWTKYILASTQALFVESSDRLDLNVIRSLKCGQAAMM
jgi:hypothetical protein